jgi:hypothetical protein
VQNILYIYSLFLYVYKGKVKGVNTTYLSPDIFVLHVSVSMMLHSQPTGPRSIRRPFMWNLWASEWNLMGSAPNASVYPCNSSFLPNIPYSSITASDVCDRLDQLAWSLIVVAASTFTWHLRGRRPRNLTCSILLTQSAWMTKKCSLYEI